MTATKLDILKAIETLNLKRDVICIHSSLKSFGLVEGGAQTIINPFLEKGFTILAPTFTYDYFTPPIPGDRPDRNGCDYENYPENPYGNHKVFTVESQDISKKYLGAIPYEILTMPERKRGYHPLNSFTSIGSKADDLVAEQSPINVYTPLKKLYDMEGYIILMGVDLTSMTAIHYAEKKAGRNLFIQWANDLDGKPMRVLVGSCSRGFNKFDSILKKVEKNITVGNSLWRIFPMKEAIDICAKAIIENPMITHCHNPECERCDDAVQGGPIL